MARVTVEDCILTVPNRFELVLLAAKRAREISAGAPLTLARDNDKNPVVSLREISENSIDVPALRENLVRGLQKRVFVEAHEVDLDKEVTQALDGKGLYADDEDFLLDEDELAATAGFSLDDEDQDEIIASDDDEEDEDESILDDAEDE